MAKNNRQKIKNKEIFFFLTIFFIALLLRVWKFNQIPPSLFGDEVDTGYQAYSILKTGRDYFGNLLPVHFQSLGDWRMPLYIYLTVPSLAIFGVTDFAVRLPSLIFNLLSILVIWLLLRKITQEKIALLATFLLAISPWHIHFSLLGLEVGLMNLLLLLGFYFFLSDSFTLAAISWGFSLYSYSTTKLFVPLLMTGLLIVYWSKIFNRKRILDFWIPFLVVLIPMFYSLIFSQGAARFSTISIFSDKTVPQKVEELRRECPFTGKAARIIHNKVTVWWSSFLANYLRSFSPEFLFLSGDPSPRHNPTAKGELYWIYLPMIIFGLFYWLLEFLKTKDKRILFITTWMLLTPIPAALTQNGGTHAIRLFQFFPWWEFLAASGLFFLTSLLKINWQKRLVWLIFSGILFLNFFSFSHSYFFHFPRKEGQWWQWWNYGYRDLFKYLNTVEDNYQQIYISPGHEPPIIYSLFYNHYPPKEIQKEMTISPVGYGKYLFAEPDFSFLKTGEKKENILFVATPGLPKALGYELETNPKIEILKKIFYPNGEVVFYVFQTR